MSSKLRIDVVAPPFGGHLHPQLDLANRIRQASGISPRMISTPIAAEAAALYGLEFKPVLASRESIVQGIANTPHRVGSNPRRLLDQLHDNISMMDQLVDELTQLWQHDRPQLVIADFAVPVAGLLAERLGIGWWTAIRAPTVIDTPDGVPCYFGGLRPRPDWIGRLRDRMGRTVIHGFKRIAHRLYRRSLKRLGIDSVYRRDGYERIYSSQRILIQGMPDLEFPCSWPPAATFVGPMTASPPFPHTSPDYVTGRPHVLASLGTHVGWAKDSAVAVMGEVARRMPDIQFHFTRGASHSTASVQQDNLTELSYLPYDQYMHRYALSINHAGSGIMYSCLRQGVPILAWPQDFDQFDNAARLVHHGLGLRCGRGPAAIERGVRALLQDNSIKGRCSEMQAKIRDFPTSQILLELLNAM